MTTKHEKPRRFQFGLTTLLLLPVVSAVVCAGYIWFEVSGVVVAVLGCAIVFSYLPAFRLPDGWGCLRESLRITAFLLILAILMVTGREESRKAARRAQCRNNMKQIALALQNYNADFGCLPPAYIADETGKPMHSWRVLILPYLERKEIYSQYNFDEPWDGPTNSRLSRYVVEEYVCPSEPWNKPAWETNYFAVVGEGTLWPGSEPFSMTGPSRELRNKILIVEVAGSGISWLEPNDLNIDQMSFEINDWSRPCIRSHHRGGGNIAFADGTVRFLKRRNQDDLKKLLKIDNGRVTEP